MDNIKKIVNKIAEGEVGVITTADLKNRLKGKNDLYILDIRRKEDYEKGHIDRANHCEWFDIRELLEKDSLPKDKTIIVACYSGQSSMQVATILNVSGYKALSLLDGMNEWTGDMNNE